MLPLFLGSLCLGPRHAAVVRRLRPGAAHWCSLLEQPELNAAHRGRGRRDLRCSRFIILLTSFRRSRLGVAGRHGRVDAGRPARPDPAAGRLPDAAAAVVRRVGAAVGRRHARSPATSSSPRDVRRPAGSTSSVVDVSGKGDEAGTRALLLSGAFGGLLTAAARRRVPARRQRLPAAARLGRGLRDRVHLSPRPGHRRTSRSGRPATRRPCSCTPGRGRWSVLESEGPVLGLIARRRVRRASAGRAAPGDALLLYTDGLVETRSRDIELGIDRLSARPSGCCASSFDGGAARLVDALGSTRRRPRAAAGAPALTGASAAADVAPVRGARRPLWHDGTRSGARAAVRGCSSMVEPQSSKLITRVRFPSSAPGRVPDAVREPPGGA